MSTALSPSKPAVDFAQMQTLGDIARYHARERPDAPALVFEARETSFAAFDRRSNQVANALLAEGLKSGDRIAYVGKNSDHYFELLFGAAKMGAVMTPIGWRLAPPEAAYIIGDAEASIVFVGPEVIGHAAEVAAILADPPKVVATMFRNSPMIGCGTSLGSMRSNHRSTSATVPGASAAPKARPSRPPSA